MFPISTQFEHAVKGQNHYRLAVAYDGTDFYGWQVQPDLPTIQGELAMAVERVTGERVLPQGSGRTDSGVHALGQAVSLSLAAPIPADRLLRALNRRLPPAIRVLTAGHVSATFHARAAVISKTYEYRIFERVYERVQERAQDIGGEERVCPPALARFVWDYPRPLCRAAMQQAAMAMAGTHDFTSFAAADPDRTHRLADQDLPVNNIRTIHQSAWQHENDLLVYRVTGTGFLHHMVRNIVGTCVEAGVGRMQPDAIPSILQARDRHTAGPTAPPQGLHLIRVVYQGDEAGQSVTADA